MFELSVFRSVFGRSKSGGVDAMDGIDREWGDMVVGALFGSGSVPTVRT